MHECDGLLQGPSAEAHGWIATKDLHSSGVFPDSNASKNVLNWRSFDGQHPLRSTSQCARAAALKRRPASPRRAAIRQQSRAIRRTRGHLCPEMGSNPDVNRLFPKPPRRKACELSHAARESTPLFPQAGHHDCLINNRGLMMRKYLLATVACLTIASPAIAKDGSGYVG